MEDLTNQFVKKHELDKATSRMDALFVGVTIVLCLGFVTLLIAVLSPIIDAVRFKGQTYQDLVNAVSNQNARLVIIDEKVNTIQQLVQSKNTSQK